MTGADNDALYGGVGSDVLVGGAGDDYLAGQDDYTASFENYGGFDGRDFNWSITDAGNPFDPLGMTGGAGNDVYVVDNTADSVTENASEGTDLVQSSVTYTLAANVENLTLILTSAINGTGNTLDNVLTGNSAANTLTGAAGSDTLDGKGGNQIWLQHVGSNLEVSVIGTTDKLTVENWYTSSAYQIEQFKTTDGKLLLNTQVETFVQAMAAFSPSAAGQTTLPQNYQTALASVIAANWH